MIKSDFYRNLIFLIFCIGLRSFLLYLAYNYKDNTKYSKILAILLLAPALGFIYLYINEKRMNAPEGGNLTWWANLRIIHAILYLNYSFGTFLDIKESFVFLFIDVILGLSVFILYRFLNINFFNLFIK